MDLVGLTALLAGSETIAMTAITKYSKESNILYFIVGAVIYGLLIPYMLSKSVTLTGIGTVNFIWNIVTTIAMIVVGYFYFGDKMTHLHMISLLLGLASLTVLYLAEK